ncbi:MAG: hypothetical protein M3Y59_18120 [Myxococcota bacterium]|nr:hypothetical protein [Myxococcota bacterium]
MTRTLLIAALMFPALVVAEVPESGPVLIGPAPQIVRGGVGNQTDPHVSASVVSYTALEGTSSEIRYQDLTDPSSDVAIPNGGHRDSLSDVSGNVVVFRRVFTDGTSTRPIMLFDQTQPGLGAQELAPQPGARRGFASAGGDTVAFAEAVGASSSAANICVASLSSPSAPASCLTTDGLNNRDPAVSPDGTSVAFAKCQLGGTGCDIYVARRNGAGGWAAPAQLTSSPGEEILPDTNGSIVTYSANAAPGDLDFDIWYQNIDGSDPRQLVLGDAPGSVESNPNISGDLIAFERELPGNPNADLYVYQLSTRTLFHLRDTPAIDETLNDISVEGDQVWVVWAAPDGLAAGHNDVWAATFTIVSEPPCEEESDDRDPQAVCEAPGDRPVLGQVIVTRGTGKPTCSSTTFGADEGESAVVCIYNDRATSGSVHLNNASIAGPSSFKHQTNLIAREATLGAVNKLSAGIAGQKGTAFEVRVYGESNACRASGLKRGNTPRDLKSAQDVLSLASGLKLPGSAGVMQAIPGMRVNSLSNGMKVLDQDSVLPLSQAMGCATSGGNALAVGVVLLAVLWVMGRRTPARVRATRRRR